MDGAREMGNQTVVARALKRAGAASVYARVFARVVRTPSTQI
jgi:hypothetical protein